MLSILKGSMKFLQKGCQAFSPLGEVTGMLLEALDAIEVRIVCGWVQCAFWDMGTVLDYDAREGRPSGDGIRYASMGDPTFEPHVQVTARRDVQVGG
jgi:hypothetical protein